MTEVASRLLRVGHSPDPDDAFMFYAIAKGRIPLRGFRIEHVVEDIESLNQRALRGELEVTAVSCHAYAYLADRYQVMRAGASVGDQYGPILVAPQSGQAQDGVAITPPEIRAKKVAVPGPLTTAYLVLQLFEGDFEPVFIPFDRIFHAVRSGSVDFGLVIHEGQITYRAEGFRKVLDLGTWWFGQTGLPLPLGVDIIRNDLSSETIRSFAALFQESIHYALAHREEALSYALEYGRGVSPQLGDRFIDMYVNGYTVDLGSRGGFAFRRLLQAGCQRGILPHFGKIPFVDSHL